ncbi:MAG: sigma 54-interacting transcriptional regulator [Planctomycetaceae bacterium]|nr:sigma 54-interacting transcriptional regulator [Planctomycetaceae bacterium]
MAARRRNLLDAILTGTASAVCVMDADGRIRFFSPGFERQTGWAADAVEGLTCEPLPSDQATPAEWLTSALLPDRDVRAGRVVTRPAVLPRPSGTLLKTNLTFLPLLEPAPENPDREGVIDRILVISDPVVTTSPSTGSVSRQLHAEISALRLEFRRRFAVNSLVGRHASVQTAMELMKLLTSADCHYSIVGPSGSGRRHMARIIHAAGKRSEQSCVELACRLLTAECLLDTLRRLKRSAGVTSGSVQHRVGTLLLCEADYFPREVQQWLLENSGEADGVRMVAVCERALDDPETEPWMIPAFRDLFAGVTMRLPSLHHRGSDVLLLAQHFIEESRRTEKTSAEGMSEQVQKQLQFYRWPGNVRELREVIMSACQNCFGSALESEHLPFVFRAGMDAQQMPVPVTAQAQSLQDLLLQYEKDVLLNTLAACDGNKAEAARRLQLTRPRLYRRLQALGLADETDS